MRLHSLSISAFGPFAGTEVVDFDALSSAGIFLMHGPTGAGKTSVLDAVSFAIFGVVPGARGQAARLRSDHARPTDPTEVCLTVTVRERRLRFTRRPGWERPKHRGAGTTREQPRVLVEELECGGPRVVSTRLDEAGAFVREIFGMTAEQFCQVVLLPQGRFADFLRADAESRRALLEQLFATSRFSAVESFLVEQRRARGRELEDARVGLTALLARIAQAARVDPMSAPSAGEDDLEVAGGWAAQLLEAALTAADEAQAEELAAVARQATARAAAQQTLELAQRQQRFAEARVREAQLAADAPKIDALKRDLETARTVMTLRPCLTAEATTRRVREDRAASEAFARRSLPTQLREASAVDLQREHQRLSGELAILGELRTTEKRFAELRELSETTRAENLSAKSASASAGEELRRLPEVRAQAQATRRAAENAALLLPRAEAESSEAAQRAQAARERDAVARHLAELTVECSRAATAAQELREHWLDLRQARLDGMAAELAGDLRPGQACAVCGSATHPAPAVDAERGPTPEDEQEAFSALTLATATRDTLLAKLGEVTARHAALLALTGAHEAADLAHTAAALRKEASQVATLAATAPAAQVECERLDARSAHLAAAVHGAEIAQAEATTRLERLAAELAEADLRLERARGTDSDLSTRIARLQREQAAEAEAVEAVLAAAEGVAAHEAAAEQARAATAAAGLTLEDAVRADTDPAVLERCRTRVAEYERGKRSVEDVLGDTELLAAAASPSAPVATAAGTLVAADQAASSATVRRAATADAVLSLEQLTLELTSTLHELAPLQERYVSADGISQLVEGKGSANTLRMRLSAYVLAARLESVAAAANARLHDMTGGRYSLAYTDESSGARGRAGLGLRILDAWTGRERDPATLSGGETFMASLALALGLADVATAEAGGVLLDTLLIDEGFGALDEDSLEEVMTVLDGLREGGRTVGLVSHVADLRDRIPAQLVVRKGRAGSRLEFAGLPTVPGASAPGKAVGAAAGHNVGAESGAAVGQVA